MILQIIKRNKIIYAIVGALLLLRQSIVLAEGAQEYIARIKNQTKPGQVIFPEILSRENKYSPFEYNGTSVRNPFTIPADLMKFFTPEKKKIITPAKIDIIKTPRPDNNRIKEYLESFELDKLKMIGSISKDDDIWGLVMDESGIVHKVKVGDYLGRNSGKIINISESKISLEELIEDGLGGWKKHGAELAVQE